MPEKLSDNNNMPKGWQGGDSPFDRLTVLPMPELPRLAASCHPDLETFDMYDFTTTSQPIEICNPSASPTVGGEAIADRPPLKAAAIRAAIENCSNLKPSQKRPLITAVNHAEDILASRHHLLAGAAAWSCAGLNRVLWQSGEPVPGLSHDAFRNMVTCLRTILIRFGRHADSGHKRNKLSLEWDAYYKALPTNEYRKGLVRFFRFLTLLGVTPETVDTGLIEKFDHWCRTEILLADPNGLTRRTAGNWEFARKNVAGWPNVELRRPGMRDQYALPFDEAPASFNADVDRFLAGGKTEQASGGRVGNVYAGLLARKAAAQNAASENRKGRGRGLRARTDRTIDTRRWQIQVAMTALVESGTPIEEIKSLGMLAFPLANPVAILDWHSARHEKRLIEKGIEVTDETMRSDHLKGIGELLLQIGRYEADLSDDDADELADVVRFVSPKAQKEMSEKNRTRLKALFEDRTYATLLKLPEKWMKDAEKREGGPLASARLAMYAAALEILLILPLRRINLLQLKLDTNLRRPALRSLIDEICIPAGQVKNGVPIQWPVDAQSARLLEKYIREFRPHLAKPANMFLFPGIGDSHRDDAEFGDRLSKQVAAAIGAEFNCHLARHFSVVRYLRKNPGAYEIAALILGHKSPETTRSFYCGLEIDAAARHVNKVLFEDRRGELYLADRPLPSVASDQAAQGRRQMSRNRSARGAPHLVLPLELWPVKDRASWRAGTDPMPRLQRCSRYADRLTPRSIDLARKSYGRLLAVQEMNGLLDPEIGPLERITVEAAHLYFDELRAAGNIDNSIKGRLFHLRTAMHIMTPGQNFDWITRPDGVSLDALLKQCQGSDMFIPDALALYEWGLSLMNFEKLPGQLFQRLEACREFRNGLIITLLDCRAPRLESLSRMRLGRNLERVNGEYWVRLESMIVKNRRTLEYTLPGV